jgi:hypothetical protein
MVIRQYVCIYSFEEAGGHCDRQHTTCIDMGASIYLVSTSTIYRSLNDTNPVLVGMMWTQTGAASPGSNSLGRRRERVTTNNKRASITTRIANTKH